MKQAIIYLAAMMLFACSKADTPLENNKGGVKISLKLNKSFAPNGATKAIVEDNYDMTADLLAATIKMGDSVVYSWAKMSDTPEIVFLNAGDYQLEVKTGGTRSAVNAVPYYYGVSNFSVVAGHTTSIYASATIEGMAASVTFAGAVEPLTSYTMKYFDLRNPDVMLFTVTQAMNTASGAPTRVYMDTPFNFGVKIEGRLNGLKWVKNVVVIDDITTRTYHNITVK